MANESECAVIKLEDAWEALTGIMSLKKESNAGVVATNTKYLPKPQLIAVQVILLATECAFENLVADGKWSDLTSTSVMNLYNKAIEDGMEKTFKI